MQPTTLKEDILSIYIREDDTSSIIMKKIDNYCLLHSKYTGVRFAIKFFYLFLKQLKQNKKISIAALGVTVAKTSLKL